MRFYLLLILLVVSACDSINLMLSDDVNRLQPVPIVNQKGFAGVIHLIHRFSIATFEHNDPTNDLWWNGNIGNWQAGILSGNYTLYVNDVDIGVYGYVDAPLPTDDYMIQIDAAGTNVESHKANQYGIIFDYQDSSKYGLFLFNGYGQYSVGYFDDSEWYSLLVGESIVANLVNRPFSLRLTIKDELIEASFNDDQIVSVQYPKNITGTLWIYLGSRISRNASLSIYEFSVSAPNT
jgi:hypothetical protein